MKIGCDIVENSRLFNKSQRFIELILTFNEMKQFEIYGHSYLCGRFAAKEAIMKVLENTKKIAFTDIEILNDAEGMPYCINYPEIKISISHEKKFTIAVALIN